MKVTDHINNAKKPLVSFEILPPLKGKGIDSLYNLLDSFMEFNPPFINVTYHRSEYIYRKIDENTFKKVVIRKRPGTVGICAAIQLKYKVDAIPHLICGGFTKDSTEDALIDLNFLGINNVLALRGDAMKSENSFRPETGGNNYAGELVEQIMNMNKGIYLAEELKNAKCTDFCVGVAGYPEKHAEAPNMKADLKWLKQKVDLGAEYIVTQMFFDNEKFFNFVKACRENDINVPIVPGIKPITKKRQVQSIPRIFNVDIPEDLEEAIDQCKNDDDVAKVGTEWCIEQSKSLIKNGSPIVHYYTMGKASTFQTIARAVY